MTIFPCYLLPRSATPRDVLSSLRVAANHRDGLAGYIGDTEELESHMRIWRQRWSAWESAARFRGFDDFEHFVATAQAHPGPWLVAEFGAIVNGEHRARISGGW